MFQSLKNHPFRFRIILFAVALFGVACYLLFRAPSKGMNPSPVEYPVRGVDISAHNLVNDWDALADTMDFVFIKATEGGNWNDRHFEANYRAARNAGMRVGVYHFFRYDREAVPQAINFFNALWGKKLDFPAVIDVEDHGNPKGVATDIVATRLKEMVSFLEKRDVQVMFYTNKDGYAKIIEPNFPHYPIWICSLSDTPSEDLPWIVWQFSHRVEIPGVKGKVDLNVLRNK